jgi:hypothetical protein
VDKPIYRLNACRIAPKRFRYCAGVSPTRLLNRRPKRPASSLDAGDHAMLGEHYASGKRGPRLPRRLRAILTYLGGIVVLSLIAEFGGRQIALAALAVMALLLLMWVLFSPRPAYRLADRDGPNTASQP